MAAADQAAAERSRRGCACRGDHRDGCNQPGRRGNGRPAAARRSRSAYQGNGRGRPCRQLAQRGCGCRGGGAAAAVERCARYRTAGPSRRRCRDPHHRAAALPSSADPAPVRPGARGRRRSDGRRACRGSVGLHLRANAGRAAAPPAVEGARPRGAGRATASRSSRRSRTSCAIRTRMPGSGGTFPRRSPAFRVRRASTPSSLR